MNIKLDEKQYREKKESKISVKKKEKSDKTIINALKMNTRRIVIHASLSDNKYVFSQNKTVTVGDKNHINDSILKRCDLIDHPGTTDNNSIKLIFCKRHIQ